MGADWRDGGQTWNQPVAAPFGDGKALIAGPDLALAWPVVDGVSFDGFLPSKHSSRGRALPSPCGQACNANGFLD